MKQNDPRRDRSQAPTFAYKKQSKQKRRSPLAARLSAVGRSISNAWRGFCALFARLSPRALAVVAIFALLIVNVPITALALLSPTRRNIERISSAASGPRTVNLNAPASPTPLAQEASEDGVVILNATPIPMPTPNIIATPTPSPTPEPHPSNMVIRHGVEAPVVAEIQERLMDLDYMERDEPTQYFGNITENAVRLFQRQHGLDVDGKVGMETYELLMSDEATHYMVTIGADGTDVSELQSRLRELGYMDSVTGHFGESTEAAVKKFQQLNDLTDDGKVGSKTREALYSADAKANYMKYGEKSDEIKEYQELLKKLGYLTTTPDGSYGKDTTMAVKRFQELNGLIPDGFLGYNTIRMLKSSHAQANALKLGMEGKDVERVQTLLKKLGYMSNVTGYFGSQTEDAVKAFQKRNDLGADGIVGKSTMNKLTSSKAKKAASSSSGKTGSGSSSGGSSGSSSSGSSNSSGVEKLISVAKSKLGCTYVFSSKGPNTFDCSGFVYYCLNHAGISQGYMTSAAWQNCSKYPRIHSMSDLRRGDIISFEGHVGIYLGDGEMINASSSKGKVCISSGILKSNYWKSHFVCGFRVY